MRKLFQLVLVCAMLLMFNEATRAQTTMPMPAMPEMHMLHMMSQISVVATGSVDYVPDIARITLGMRAQATTAARAADTVNRNAAQTIAAVEALGIGKNNIKTSGYNLEYREPQPVQDTMGTISPPQAIAAQPPSMAARPGQYVASEILQITAPVNIAGRVLDAGITAGANESFGLSYQSSNADALYRSALAKAVQAAHDTAAAIAKAAHVSLDGIESISNSTEPQPMFGIMQAAPRALASAPVLPGTDSVTATVSVVYRIK